MAIISGEQPDIKFCPACGDFVRNVPRKEMKTNRNSDKPTHKYECLACKKSFEINQDF